MNQRFVMLVARWKYNLNVIWRYQCNEVLFIHNLKKNIFPLSFKVVESLSISKKVYLWPKLLEINLAANFFLLLNLVDVPSYATNLGT